VRVLVEHEPGYAAAIERSRAARGPTRWARALDVRAWHRHERAILGSADAIVAFTARDVRTLADVSPRPVAEIRPGIRLPERPLDPLGHPPLSMLFVGNFTHPPNRDAAWRLTTTIHPTLQRRFPRLASVRRG
jgi:hypothetical protein